MAGERKPKPEEIWRRLEAEALRDEKKQAREKPDEEVLDRLASAGFDVEAEKANAAALREEMQRSAAARRARVAEARKRRAASVERRRRPVVVWLVAATLTAAAAGGGLWAITRHRAPPVPPVPSPSAPSTPAPSASDEGRLIAAADLRRQAFAACDAQRWLDCLELFDRAAEEDPAGDAAPDVRDSRRRATDALQRPPPPDFKLGDGGR